MMSGGAALKDESSSLSEAAEPSGKLKVESGEFSKYGASKVELKREVPDE